MKVGFFSYEVPGGDLQGPLVINLGVSDRVIEKGRVVELSQVKYAHEHRDGKNNGRQKPPRHSIQRKPREAAFYRRDRWGLPRFISAFRRGALFLSGHGLYMIVRSFRLVND